MIAPHPRHSIEDVDSCTDDIELTYQSLRIISGMPGINQILDSLEQFGNEDA